MDDEQITESNTSHGWGETLQNNKVAVALIIVLILIVLVCLVFKKESFRQPQVRDDQASGWDVNKTVKRIVNEQEQLIREIRSGEDMV